MKTDSINSTEKKPDPISKASVLQKRMMLFTLSLTRNLDLSDLTYIVIMFIDFLQIASIIINGNFFSKWQGDIFYYVQQAFSFISIQNVMHNYQEAHVGLLIAAIVMLGITLGAICFLIKYGSDIDNTSQLQKIVQNIIGFILILLKSILLIPLIFLILYAMLKFNTQNLLKIGLCISLIILLIPLLIFDILIFGDLNPFSTLVFSGETHYQRIVNLVMKIGLVVYCTFDPHRQLQLPFLIILLCIKFVGIIVSHFNHTGQQFNSKIRHYKLWQRYVLIWFIFFILIANFSSRVSTLFIYFIIISIACVVLIDYVQRMSDRKILYQNFIHLDNTKKIQAHVLRLINLIDSVHERSARILIQGYISFHARNCNLPGSTCICKQVSSHGTLQLENLKYLYYQFVANLLKGSLNRVKQPRRIYILLSFIFQYRLNNRFQAVHFLIKSEKQQNSIIQKLQYLRQMKMIESQISQAESKKNSNLAVDMMRFLKFNIKIVQFEHILDRCTNNHVDFWNQILQVHLNIKKLQKCGAVIAKQKQAVKQYFHELQELNSNNAHTMILYGQFLSWVCNQDFQNLKLLEKGETILKNLKESSQTNVKNQKYSDNSKTSIIIICGNQKQLGKIIQTNNFVKQSIGFHRKELISQNVTTIMPKIFGDNHNITLQRFLATSKDKSNGNGVERLVPVLCKDGYISPSLAFTKPIPNLEQGVQMVGFLSQYDHIIQDQLVDDKIAYILYDCDSELIMGISKHCFTEYGIPKCLVYGDPDNTSNQLKMKHIFGINLQKSEGGIENGRQLVVTINTTHLKDQFVIKSSGSTRKMIEQQENNPCYVNTQVILRSTLQITYHGSRLRIISITKDFNNKEDHEQHRKSIRSYNQPPARQQKSDSKSQSDELKDLKDFKNFISVKRQPRAIKFIGTVCVILIILFIMGVGGFITVHLLQFNLISAAFKGLQYAFKNRMYISQLSYQSQKLFINNNNAYINPNRSASFNESQLLQKMSAIIQLAKQSQTYLMPIKNILKANEITSNGYEFYPNGTYQQNQKSIDELLMVQINKLYNVLKTPGSYLKDFPLNYSSLAVVNYQQTKYTQVFSLIPSCNAVQQQIIKQGLKNSEHYKIFVIILCCILVVFAILWLLVSLPKTLQVTDINSKVLSLFNLISAEDVRSIIKRCYIFQNKYLIQTDVDQKKIELLGDDLTKQKDISYLKRRSAISQLKQLPGNTNSSFLETSARMMVTPSEMKNKDTMNLDTFDDVQQNSTINRDNGDKKKAIMTFILIFLFITAYSASITVYLILNYNFIQIQAKTMNAVYNRTAQFQEIKTTYVKFLMDKSLNDSKQTIGAINNGLIYKIYETERSLVEQGQFSTFGSIINAMSTQDICSNIDSFKEYKLWGNNDLSVSQCQSTSNQILTRGIKTSLVTIMEEIRSMISMSEAERSKLDIYTLLVQTINRYSILQKYIVRPLIMISQQIIDMKLKNEQRINLTFFLLNGIFLLLVLLFWKFAWRRYLQYLNETVWRTKSMLNVIPSKIITNNQILMNEFTSGQLQKVVR